MIGKTGQAFLQFDNFLQKKNVYNSKKNLAISDDAVFACLWQCSFVSQQIHFISTNSMCHSFAPSYIPCIHMSPWHGQGDIKQIPYFLPVLGPKRFSMSQWAIKCNESPEEDRDEWARHDLKERVHGQTRSLKKDKTACVEWACGTFCAWKSGIAQSTFKWTTVRWSKHPQIFEWQGKHVREMAIVGHQHA